MSRRSFAHDLISVVTSRILSRICQFLVGVVAARLIGPEGRGLIAALTVAPDLALTFSQLGVRQSVAYHIGRKTYALEEVVPTLLGLVISSNTIAIAACLAYYWAAGLIGQNWIYLALALAPISFSLLTNYASGVFLGKEMIVRFNRVNWVPPALNLLFITVVAWGADLGIAGVMISALIATIASSGYALYLLHKLTPLRIGFDREIAAKLTKLGVIYATALFALTLNYKLPILLLQHLGTLTDVGIYAVGQTLALMIWEIPGMLSTLVFSRGVNRQDSPEFSASVIILTRLVVLAGTIVAVGCAIAGPLLIPLIYGADFAASARVLTILLPGTVAFMAFKIFHMDIAARGKPWFAMTVVIPSIIFNAGLSTLIIPRYGADGAAAVTSASYVLATIAYLIIYARMIRVSIPSILVYRRSDFTAVITRLRKIRK
jgi:O-antigen/teichoic acid export membrane protein